MEEAYRYAATADGISKWFIGKADYYTPDGTRRAGNELIQKGDSYEWDWLYKELGLKGEVLDVNGRDYVKFTFGDTAIFNIKLSEVDDRVLFTLTQESNPDNPMAEEAHINCYVCWTLFVLNLKSVAENGIDLREWNYDMDGLVNW
jgi:hypothetical protein